MHRPLLALNAIPLHPLAKAGRTNSATTTTIPIITASTMKMTTSCVGSITFYMTMDAYKHFLIYQIDLIHFEINALIFSLKGSGVKIRYSLAIGNIRY
jgi:hypothetical protein